MLLTEQEAQDRWCPMVRVAGENLTCNDGDPRRPGSFHCIGSRCAMWRWRDQMDPLSDQPRFGYCGLAGTPVAR